MDASWPRPRTPAIRLSGWQRPRHSGAAALLACAAALAHAQTSSGERPRARDLGVAPGVFAPGPNNAITDVAGVRVGQVTIDGGDRIRTGVTAILPHPGNAYLSRVPAAIHVGNAFGKLVGATQVKELGEIETPILLTCTLCVWKAADAMADWMLGQPGMERVRSLNPVVGETNDGTLNDIRSRPVTAEDVRRALEGASDGPVEEGSVGAGRGTVAFGWKGGIGTSSRRLPASLGGYTLGVLVQSNYGGVLQLGGAPVGKELGQYAYKNETSERGDGSVMIVVATDAPLSDRNLERVAARAMLGIGRTGSMFAFERYGVRPDILTLGKALAGGLPIGAFLAREEVAHAFQPGDHGSTFGGNPVVCAAGVATLDVMAEEHLSERAGRVGKYFAAKLRQLAERFPVIDEVRGEGLLLAVQFGSEMSDIVSRAALERGLLLNAVMPSAIRLMPPLVITEAEVDEAVAILDAVLADQLVTA